MNERGVQLTLDLIPKSDRMTASLKDITESLTQSEKLAKALTTSFNPDAFKIDPKGFEGLSAAMKDVASSGEKLDALKVADVYERWTTATRSLNAELESQQSALDRYNVALDPKNIEKRVEMTLKLEDAQKRYKLSLEQEREAQTGVKSAKDEGGGLSDLGGYAMDILPGRLGAFARIGLRLHGQLSKHAKDAQEKAEKQRLLMSGDGGASLAYDDDYQGGGARKNVSDIFKGSGSRAKALDWGGEIDKLESVNDKPGRDFRLPQFQGESGFQGGKAGNLGDMLGGKSGGDMLGGGGKPGGGVLDMVGGAGKGAGGGISDLVMGGAGGGASEGLMAAAGPIGAVAAAGVMAAGALKDLTEQTFNTVKGLVAMNNPATAQRFDLALADAEATIGARLIPVVDKATEGMRLFGDVLQTVLPSASQVNTALEELRPAFNDIKESARELAPAMKALGGEGLAQLGMGLKLAASQIETSMTILKYVTPMGLMEQKDAPELKSSRGMSAQNASLGGLESIQSTILQNALSQGRSEGPPEQTVSALEKINQFLEHKVGPALDKVLGGVGVDVEKLKSHGTQIRADFATGEYGRGGRDIVAAIREAFTIPRKQ